MELKRYNLRAVDEDALASALQAAGVIDQWGNVTRGMTLDVIGIIQRPTGEMIEGEGGQYPALAPVAGWHANLIAPLSDEQEALIPLIPAPVAPYRVFAGE